MEQRLLSVSSGDTCSRSLNWGVDLLSRGTLGAGNWSLQPAVMEQIWARFGRASVWAEEERTGRALLLPGNADTPLGIDV